MKIYTKGGDYGKTSLGNGKRGRKTDISICINGDIDELNAILGICAIKSKLSFHKKILIEIQSDLFEIGACVSKSPLIKDFSLNKCKKLEKWIDEIEKKNSVLKNFILPGGSEAGAFLHLARTVCRRSERSFFRIKNQLITIGSYLNRLSDLLFVMARSENKKIPENIWNC